MNPYQLDYDSTSLQNAKWVTGSSKIEQETTEKVKRNA